MINSNLSITRRCYDFLLERITQLERNKLNNAQYTRRETLQINPVPSDITEPDNLQACHRMRRKDRVIIKFKCRKQKHRVLLSRKTL